MAYRRHRFTQESAVSDSANEDPAPGRRTLTEGLVARRAAGATHEVDAACAGGGGISLPDGLRSRLESTASADLGQVRVHTGPDSMASAAALGARAYAVGHDIHFGAGEYAPGTAQGDHLIAHEVAHTLQQGAAAPQKKLEISQPGDAREQEADAFADAFVAAEPAAALTRGAAAIARAPKSQEDPAKKDPWGARFHPTLTYPSKLQARQGKTVMWDIVDEAGEKQDKKLGGKGGEPDYEWTVRGAENAWHELPHYQHHGPRARFQMVPKRSGFVTLMVDLVLTAPSGVKQQHTSKPIQVEIALPDGSAPEKPLSMEEAGKSPEAARDAITAVIEVLRGADPATVKVHELYKHLPRRWGEVKSGKAGKGGKDELTETQRIDRLLELEGETAEVLERVAPDERSKLGGDYKKLVEELRRTVDPRTGSELSHDASMSTARQQVNQAHAGLYTARRGATTSFAQREALEDAPAAGEAFYAIAGAAIVSFATTAIGGLVAAAVIGEASAVVAAALSDFTKDGLGEALSQAMSKDKKQMLSIRFQEAIDKALGKDEEIGVKKLNDGIDARAKDLGADPDTGLSPAGEKNSRLFTMIERLRAGLSGAADGARMIQLTEIIQQWGSYLARSGLGTGKAKRGGKDIETTDAGKALDGIGFRDGEHSLPTMESDPGVDGMLVLDVKITGDQAFDLEMVRIHGFNDALKDELRPMKIGALRMPKVITAMNFDVGSMISGGAAGIGGGPGARPLDESSDGIIQIAVDEAGAVTLSSQTTVAGNQWLSDLGKGKADAGAKQLVKQLNELTLGDKLR